MSGFITKIEVVQKADWIIEKYGVLFYAACLSSEGETFLSLLVKFDKIWN